MKTIHMNKGIYAQIHTYRNEKIVDGLGHSFKWVLTGVMPTDWEGKVNDWGDNMST